MRSRFEAGLAGGLLAWESFKLAERRGGDAKMCKARFCKDMVPLDGDQVCSGWIGYGLKGKTPFVPILVLAAHILEARSQP